MPTTPEIVRTVGGLRDRVAIWRRDGGRVGLVPTMGALHDGHLALVRRSLDESDRTVVSIFVNPTQFAPHEDFETYPRDEARDIAAIGAMGTDVAYLPDASEMYADGFTTTVSVAGPSDGLCGAVRPHFFQGVATVVSKLLLQCLPDRAYFGEKDYQQLLVIKRLVRDLDIPVGVVGVPTVRESDGLALSSRNAYLSDADRKTAPLLNATMRQVADKVAHGDDVAMAETWGRVQLQDNGFDPVDYLEVRDADTLAPIEGALAPRRLGRVFAAAYLGKTRLIDNIPVARAP